MPHHLKIWDWRSPKCIKIDPKRPQCPITSKSWGPPKCFKIYLWRPTCPPSPPNLALEISKLLQNPPLEAQMPHRLENLALETSKMLQNRSLKVQVPITSKYNPGDLQYASKSIPGRLKCAHQLQIWPWRPPKWFKINSWRPKSPSPPNLALETSKMLQKFFLE